MKVIAVFGRKNSGKTYLITRLIRALREKRILAIKHIHEENFEVDYEGKDTWFFSKSGANSVAAISSKKFFILAKGNMNPLDLIKMLKCMNLKYDYAFIEGFHNLLGSNPLIYKVIIGRNESELKELISVISTEKMITIFLNGLHRSEIRDIIDKDIPILELNDEGIHQFSYLIENKLEDNL